LYGPVLPFLAIALLKLLVFQFFDVQQVLGTQRWCEAKLEGSGFAENIVHIPASTALASMSNALGLYRKLHAITLCLSHWPSSKPQPDLCGYDVKLCHGLCCFSHPPSWLDHFVLCIVLSCQECKESCQEEKARVRKAAKWRRRVKVWPYGTTLDGRRNWLSKKEERKKGRILLFV